VPGFGSGSFGYGPFGRYDWAKHVLFKDLPEPDRQLDVDVGGGRLEKFVDSIVPSFDFLLDKVVNFGDLRNPDTVRTQFNEVIAVTVLSAVSIGRVIEVTVAAGADPFDPLGDTGLGWILRDISGREYKVNAVHKLRPNVIEVVGISDLPSAGAATLRPPSMIELLGADYGIDVDFHEPEAFQRSSVRNAVQWFDLKASEKSYDIIGKIAGYRVTPLALWSVELPIPTAIPSSRVYEMPAGSGLFYTDLSPMRPMLDEVAADVVPLDVLCYEVSGAAPDGTWLGPPPVGLPDGTTLSAAIGFTMQSRTVTALDDLGGGLWQITVNPADLTPISSVGQWYFEVAGVKYWLETLPVFVTPKWIFNAYLGLVPPIVVGEKISFSYECREAMDCGFCRASVIRIEVVPAEVLTDPDALLEGVLTRLVTKILQVIPIHVRIADIVHLVSVQVPVSPSLLVSTQASMFVYNQVGYYYDLVPADELPLDQDHMVIGGVVFTVP